MMSNPKRLHPAAILFDIIQSLKQSILGILPIAIVIISNGASFYLMIGIAVIIGLIILSSVLSWVRFTYQLEEDQLRIERGIIIRKKRTISKHRIQSIDLSQNVIHRIFGLTKVAIETAGNDSSTDAALSAVRMEDGRMLHDELKYKKHVSETEALEAEKEINTEQTKPDESNLPKRTITLKALFITGSTSASFGILIGLFGAAFSQVESLIPDQFYNDITRWALSLGMQIMIIFAIIVVLFLWLLSILYTVVKDWNFTITRYEKELFITRGLLEKKQTTIPLKRIQAVGIKESPVHQLFGFARPYVEIASATTNNSQEVNTSIFPLLRKKEFASFLSEFLPEYHYSTENLIHPPKKALPYYLWRSMNIPLLAVIIVGIFFSTYIWIPIIIMFVIGILGFAAFKSAGYAIDDQQITVQARILSKDTAFIQHRRLQALKQKQHLLHRKQSLATLDMAILNKSTGRHFVIKELDTADSYVIADWYSYREDSSSSNT
ncbi:PH domain-containing protein [Oceanobacillus jeddahense]|uniref:PH domain-containing protein n=2 Tax=Oceanobacillus jeddahense TaxID=1462527 RepID=A0ABY5JQX5_9BACI|nr:PH domain-containing protein [Oceanobacillus jeddahense]UUI02691.1 PH domain-containing protein [Oceanobacillus jeddahense]